MSLYFQQSCYSQTKNIKHTGRILALGLDSMDHSMDQAQHGPYIIERGPIFSQYSPDQAWVIRDLLHDFVLKNSCGD